MNLPTTLDNAKAAAMLEEAAELIQKAAKLMDRAADRMDDTYTDRLNDIPGMYTFNHSDETATISTRLHQLATDIYQSEGM